MPKQMHHFVTAKGETIVQVHAMGPFVLNYVDPADDPRLALFFEDFLASWVRATPEAATFSRMLPSAEQDRLDGQLNEIGDEAEHTRISRAKDGLASLRQFFREKVSG